MKDYVNKAKALRPLLKNLLILSVSIGAGMLGVHQSRELIEARITQLSDKPVPPQIMTQVVVPSRPLSRGDIVNSDDLSLREIPQQYADSNSVTAEHYARALGQRLDFDIDEGRALLWAHLAGGVSPTFSGNVTRGLRAMTVRVDDINSFSGFLQPGDKVDLLLSLGLGEAQKVVPIIQQLEVIATGSQTKVDKQGGAQPRNFSTITVHVNPQTAQKLTLAQQTGKLTAVLRNPDDKAQMPVSSMTLAQLLGAAEPDRSARAVRLKTAKKVKVAAMPVVPLIEYIIGGKQSVRHGGQQ